MTFNHLLKSYDAHDHSYIIQGVMDTSYTLELRSIRVREQRRNISNIKNNKYRFSILSKQQNKSLPKSVINVI